MSAHPFRNLCVFGLLAALCLMQSPLLDAAPPPKTLTITIDGSGSVTADPAGPDYERGTVVTLTAMADTGYVFDHWSGDLSGSNNPETITMSKDKSVTAHFVPEPCTERTLTVNTNGPGSVTQDPSSPYCDGDTVTLTANPDPGYLFDSWSGDLTGSNNPETILMDADKTVTAHFVAEPCTTRTLTININGSGSVGQTPAPPYCDGDTVTLTANPASGWQFDSWSGDLTGSNNPESILLDADKTVTANFSEIPSGDVTLTINVIGQGEVITTPDPPYSLDQVVTLAFYPSAGHQFITKPDIDPATPTDPYVGWAFDHWSFDTTTPQFGNNALSNPVDITLTTDTTIYATFLNNGSGAHLTANQESQLMDIARNVWNGWDSMTQAQADQLFIKAENALAEYRNRSERYGQATTIWYTNFDRIEGGHVYDFCGEGMTWTGVHMLALALKHSQMPTDQTTIDDLNRALDAMDRNSQIAGQGYAIRYSAPTSDAAWQWYYSQYGGGAYQGLSPWSDYTYIATTTRDVHTGYFLGLAAVIDLCSDVPTLYNKAQAITERIVDRLIADGWRLEDGHCSFFTCELNNTNLEQLQKRCAFRVNPTKYSSFLSDIENFTLNIGTQKSLYASDYWVAWMGWGQGFGITLLETDPTKKQQFMEHFKTRYDDTYLHHNALFVAMANYFDPGTLPGWAYAQAQGLPLAFPDGIKWHRKVDLFQDPRFTTYNSEFVTEAALPNQRVHADFDPQRSAAKAQGGELNFSYQYTNVEMYLSYWLGRASGKIPAPTP